jgi:TonB-dependent SusC/RagA subfamily outer membrane receptor
VNSDIKTNVSNNISTNTNKQTVNTTQSVNTQVNQQKNTINVSSATPENHINISVNQSNPGDSSSSLKINNSGPEPLYVVDGVITSKATVNGLDPNRIASIDVLKGTSATKLYGDNGKNGVVQITMKK